MRLRKSADVCVTDVLVAVCVTCDVVDISDSDVVVELTSQIEEKVI